MSTSIMNAVKRALEGRGFKRGLMGATSTGGGDTTEPHPLEDTTTHSLRPKKKKKRPHIEILEILDSSDDEHAPTVVPPPSIQRRTKRRRRRRTSSDEESSTSTSSNDDNENHSEEEEEEENSSEEEDTSHPHESEEREPKKEVTTAARTSRTKNNTAKNNNTTITTTTNHNHNHNHKSNRHTPTPRTSRRVTPRYRPSREQPALTRHQKMKQQQQQQQQQQSPQVETQVPIEDPHPTQTVGDQDTSETETEPEEDEEEEVDTNSDTKEKETEQVAEEVVEQEETPIISTKDGDNSPQEEEQVDNDNEVQSSSPSSSQIVLPQRDENGYLSNIAHVKPWVGMKLEIRDTDYIWSAARLVEITREKVVSDKNGEEEELLFVKVHCEGWDSSQWDERVPWPCSRLARLYTYTKRVKCFVNLLPKVRSRKGSKPAKGRKVPTNLWPCTVQIRMPHPVQYTYPPPTGGNGDDKSPGGEGVCDDEEQCLLAEELLKLEEKVFVQPYGIRYLPQWIIDSLDVDKGRWFNINKVKLWRSDPEMEFGALPKDFMTAFQEAVNDTDITGFLPARIFGQGSLVDDFFRVRTREGENLGGALREGTIPRPPPPPRNHNNHTTTTNSSIRPDAVMSSGGGNDQQLLLQGETSLQESGEMDGTHTKEDSREAILRQLRLKYEPPPSLPPSVRLPEPIYPGVIQCKTSKGWVASVSISGNDAFLGTYPSQTEAWTATKLAAQKDDNDESTTTTPIMTSSDAKIADMKAIPIETIIEATEREFNRHQHNYSLHEWTLQKIKHTAYEKQIQKYEQPQQQPHEDHPQDKVVHKHKKKNGETGGVGKKTNDPDQTKKKKSRKQRQPRKVDLKTKSYHPS